MRYKKQYERAVVEPPETRKIKRLNLDVCQRCEQRLSSYELIQDDGTLLLLCSTCYLAKDTSK